MTDQGLTWLADSPLARTPTGFCLTLAQGATEEEMFEAFGADPAAAVPRRWQDLREIMHVQVGRCGDWVFALEINSANGTRPPVLRKASAAGKAVAVRCMKQSIRHQFGYAEDGNLLAQLNLEMPHWQGPESGRFEASARESGYGNTVGRSWREQDYANLRALLTVAGRMSGSSIGEADLDRARPSAELPPLPLEERSFCVTLTRGLDESKVFSALGADPGEAVPRRRREIEHSWYVQVGRVGEWTFALELFSDEGIKAKTLRRLSKNGQAIATHYDFNDISANFVYAEDGDLVARVNTDVPLRWTGSDPARFEAMGPEAGLPEEEFLPGAAAARAVLELARRSGGSGGAAALEEAGRDRAWPTAPVLPSLKEADMPPEYADRAVTVDDEQIARLIAQADDRDLRSVLAVRMHRLMAAAELDAYPALMDVLEAALTGNPRPVKDDDPAGLILRRLAWEEWESGSYFYGRLGQPAAPEGDLLRRTRVSNAARLILIMGVVDPRKALSYEVNAQKSSWDPAGWHERILADFAQAGIDV